jgi:predicted O-methyltransferase YrrM
VILKKILLKKALNFSNYKFIYEKIKKIKKINILEFGVREGLSTSMFLSLCDKNSGKLMSVDVDDYKKLFKNTRWTFLKCRDDNFYFVKKHFKRKLDVIYIDSYHEPEHIKKILFYYYKFLKKNGYVFIDDISWLPYIKGSYRENSWNEITNRRTFLKIIDIFGQNLKNFNLEFCFDNSGMAMLKKKNSSTLIEPKKILNSELKLKNFFLRMLLKRKPRK